MKKGEIVTQENLVIGAKVLRGPDWSYNNQDKNSIYGITEGITDIDNDYVRVSWYDKNLKVTNSNSYRIGIENNYDLIYYESDHSYLQEQKKALDRINKYLHKKL